MVYQPSLFEVSDNSTKKIDCHPKTIFLLTWNVANPSLVRAKEQWLWLESVQANVIILTETKVSEGCSYLYFKLKNAGYELFSETYEDDKYGVLVAVRGFEVSKINLNLHLEYLKSRIVSVEVKSFLGKILIIGLYVPSRGNKEMRNVDKSNFQKTNFEILKRCQC